MDKFLHFFCGCGTVNIESITSLRKILVHQPYHSDYLRTYGPSNRLWHACFGGWNGSPQSYKPKVFLWGLLPKFTERSETDYAQSLGHGFSHLLSESPVSCALGKYMKDPVSLCWCLSISPYYCCGLTKDVSIEVRWLSFLKLVLRYGSLLPVVLTAACSFAWDWLVEPRKKPWLVGLYRGLYYPVL